MPQNFADPLLKFLLFVAWFAVEEDLAVAVGSAVAFVCFVGAIWASVVVGHV